MPQSLLSVQQPFLPVSDLSAAPPCRVSAAGRGGSKYNPENPQPKNQSNHNFLQKKCEIKTKSISYHTNHPHTHTPDILKNSPHNPQNNQNPTYPQHYPQTHQKESKQTTQTPREKNERAASTAPALATGLGSQKRITCIAQGTGSALQSVQTGGKIFVHAYRFHMVAQALVVAAGRIQGREQILSNAASQ